MIRIAQLRFLDWEAISLEVEAGEVICLRGDSGSGKSLFLRAVADLIPHEGQAFLNGVSCSQISPTDWRRQVCFQSAEALWWEDLVGDHFLDRPGAGELERLALPAECLEWQVSRLSMGERQRLGLLRMLDRQPKVLLLDEPTSNLDDTAASAVESLILEYIDKQAACSIWVTHSDEQAKRVGQRTYRMENKALREVAL